MGINGIGTAGYLPTGCTGRKDTKTEKTFADMVNQKSAEANKEEKMESGVRILDYIAEHAPDEVKQAFLEAEKETGGFLTVYGLWISNDGKQSYMTQMGVERFVRWYNGDFNQSDLLGTSVESAISAAKRWIYEVDHPLAGSPAKSMEEQRLLAMERAFYVSFLDKLNKLKEEKSYNPIPHSKASAIYFSAPVSP